jgi:hypothetical protein
MVAATAIIAGVAALITGLVTFVWRTFCRLSPREHILIAQREAARRVDDLFDEARIRMEEAAGRRSPGEHRIGDGFGSWNRW